MAMAQASYSWVDSGFPEFLADDITVKSVSERWERNAYYSLRRSVFSDEQKLLVTDRDAHDFGAIAIVAIANVCGMADQVVGAVRIYEQQPGLWYGGRLCVDRDYRQHGCIGKALINEAVSRAANLGCQRFLATVQASNESYFHDLHWQTLEAIVLLGKAHYLMQADLACYPLHRRELGRARQAVAS